MEKIQFDTRVLTIVSTDISFNQEYFNAFPEMHFNFDDEDCNLSFSFIETDEVESELNVIQNMFQILECNKASEMIGCKLRVLMYRINEVDGWENIGFGSCNDNKFIDIYGDGTIVTREELEKDCRNRN